MNASTRSATLSGCSSCRKCPACSTMAASLPAGNTFSAQCVKAGVMQPSSRPWRYRLGRMGASVHRRFSSAYRAGGRVLRTVARYAPSAARQLCGVPIAASTCRRSCSARYPGDHRRHSRGTIQEAERSGNQGNWKYMMYQLRSTWRGSVRTSRPRSTIRPNGRNAAGGGTDMITALANGLSGIAARPVAASAPQSWPITTSRSVPPAAERTRRASSITAPMW